MRKYLFITLIVFSCNSDYKGKKVNNAPSNFVTFEIYPSDNIAIRLPSKCTLIDSTSFGQRKTIISRDKQGVFIPICTKNVFLKYFSEYPPRISFWTQDDREKYEEDIFKVLKNYLT